MARKNNESTGARKGIRGAPATVFEFPRSESHSEQSETRDFTASRTALSPTEQALYDEFIATARALDKRNVPGVYAHVANVTEVVSEIKAEWGNAVPTLARGLDELKARGAAHARQRRETIREIMRDHEGWVLFAVLAGLLTIIEVIGAWATAGVVTPLAFILLVVSGAFMLPVLWHIWTKR